LQQQQQQQQQQQRPSYSTRKQQQLMSSGDAWGRHGTVLQSHVDDKHEDMQLILIPASPLGWDCKNPWATHKRLTQPATRVVSQSQHNASSSTTSRLNCS
jgi:hypothetical protein